MRALAVIALAVASLAVASGTRLPGAATCPVFPATNPWNERVDRLPVAARSTEIVRTIGADATLHADFGSGLWEGSPIGIPITVVPGSQKRVRVSFLYADESDRGPYPIPEASASKEAPTGTRRSSIATAAACTSCTYSSTRDRAGRPAPAPSGICARTACAPPAGRQPTPPGCRSSPALRATTRSPRASSTTRFASRSEDASRLHLSGTALRERGHRPVAPADGPAAPPEGRLPSRASRAQARVILQALKRYGMIVADNGSSWYITGAPDRRLVERPAAHAGPRARLRLRGRRHLEAPPVDRIRRRRAGRRAARAPSRARSRAAGSPASPRRSA